MKFFPINFIFTARLASRGRARNGSMGQMGHENRMGHMSQGSLGVDP